ncbi:MAG: toll/interleukin-1 receptor domain-containing protein [Bacteroidales bacterium]|nr:toll/interleukin-1 receptor domain-containing protein [Bacteroidales bacterium]
MIFISHNFKDKPIVEQIALRLRDIFGQDQVFYDSWSIQPGDGIIDKMNEGIRDCKLFLFCVSNNSLQSKMVTLEWQNAVIKATQGQTKLIPIKLDSCLMPPILLQSLYIDLFGQGLEVAMRQIVDITSGRNTFQPGPQRFSNLRAYKRTENNKIIIECHAEHYLEPISNFLFLTKNQETEISFTCSSENSFTGGFNKNIKLNDGNVYNGFFMSISRGTVPGFPLIAEATKLNNSEIEIIGVMHEEKKGSWNMIPLLNGRK